MNFHFSFSKMFCYSLEGKSITAHKIGYIAAGFKPPLVLVPVLVRNTHISLYRKTYNMLRNAAWDSHVYLSHYEQEIG